MSLSKIQDARDFSDQELDEQIQALKRQLFELRMQKATRQTVKPHLFKHTRHQLAQLMTVERERQQTALGPKISTSVAQSVAEESNPNGN